MKHSAKIVVVVPIGPDSSVEFIADTIESYIYYTKSTYKILLADDSHQQISEQVRKFYPDADVIYTTKPMGGMSGLYINLAHAFKYALNHYDFDLIFKLDTDALVIGSEPEKEALQLFHTHPDVGIAGQYPTDYSGKPWDRGWPRKRILNGVFTWKFIRRPFANTLLRKLFIKAIDNGYRPGESVFGGAYFLSRQALEKLNEEGWLPYSKLVDLNLGEDHLFSLLFKSAGYNLGDLSTGDAGFACAWKGLPAPPEELYFRKKKIIHSVRKWENMDEKDIRMFYKGKRTEYPENEQMNLSAHDLKAV